MNEGRCIVGIDVGGANLKLAQWREADAPTCVSHPFPLWRHPDQLGEAVRSLIERLGLPASSIDQLAVTMTGELADGFATRREGVRRILAQLIDVVPGQRMSVYAVGGEWLSVEQAVADPWRVAASNWHALANWIARWPTTAEQCQHALLIDIGSTTVDVVPLRAGKCASDARTDRERLERRQLIYTGLARTPVCAIVPSLNLDDSQVPVMAEFFATSDDAYLSLALVDEDPNDSATADNRPRTADCARARLARMVGEDIESISLAQINHLADQVIAAQARTVAAAIEWNLAATPESLQRRSADQPALVFTGHGRPLLERAVALLPSRHNIVALDSLLPAHASRCASAAAVAWLLRATSA